MSIEALDWDSDFFGLPVYFAVSVDVKSLGREIEKLKRTPGPKLVYVLCDNPCDLSFLESSQSAVHLMDEKVTYLKDQLVYRDLGGSAWEFEGEKPDDKLLDLAIESGVFSRFNKDPLIPRDKFEELYQRWIENSVNGKIASSVLVTGSEDHLTGMVTLGEKNNRADIGIIAVDGNARGKGVGKTLILASQNWAVRNGFKELQVVTQKENSPACRLYESCGFNICKSQYVYHVWINS
ncbi:GNAT family N-acetyltransferase [Halocola ammonii]